MRKLLLPINAIVALLAAQDTSATVSGEVRDIIGVAIAATNAELKLQDPPGSIYSVRTDNEGKFRFSGLPPGTYTLKLAQPGFKELTLKSIQVESGEQKILPLLRLDVSTGACGGAVIDYFQLLSTEQLVGNLRGHVLHEQKRYPGPAIAHAVVKLLCDDGKVCGETKTDVNGEFILVNLSAQDGYTIRVTHPGFYPLEESGYEIREGFDSTYWPVTLERCPLGNCDPALRPKRRLGVCE
jgi:hypothetical protein